MPKLSRKIEIDNFRITSVGIEAYCLVDGESVDFSINQDEFETFCDDSEMREWENDSDEDYGVPCSGITLWSEIYSGREQMYKFLHAYITNLYDMEAMDIETPLKRICTESLDQSLATLRGLQTDFLINKAIV